jgi:hypothetical protein
MKNYLYTLLATLLIGACKPETKENPEPEPSATASITLTAIHSEFHFSDSWTTKYYKGDTIRYTVAVSSDNNVTDYITKINGTVLDNVTSFVDAKDFTQDFEYVITQNPGETVTVVYSVTENNDKKTTKSISFTVSDLISYSSLRLFNKETIDKADSLTLTLKHSIEANGYIYVDEALMFNYNLNDGTAGYKTFLSTSRNMYNPGNTSKVFLKRLYTYEENPTGVFLKCSSVNYEDFTTPNSIIAHYKTNQASVATLQNNRMYIDNIQVGDIYILSFDFGTLSGPDTYAIIKITNIVDDGLTSDDIGGNDNDYIQFDIKLFGTHRF